MDLIRAFEDTQRQVRETPELAAATLCMQADTRLYLEGYRAIAPQEKRRDTVVSVVADTTFRCAQGFAGCGKVAVLNFANAYTPGGSVKHGVMAQEECLCRSSNLYEGLTIPYMLRHYYKWNEKNTGAMGSDRIIYHPRVTVFKDDGPLLENLEAPFEVDVITCAAPYYDVQKKKPVTLDKLEDVFYHRIRNILEVAAGNDVDVLILGAFGCGAFHNPPKLVARVMRRLLVTEGHARRFLKVVFAIKAGASSENLWAFREEFGV